MDKNEKKWIIISVIIFAIIVLWPKIVIQENFLETDYLTDSITFGFWDRGANLEGFYIINPDVCSFAEFSKNISCKHSSFKGPIDCSESVCSEISAKGWAEDTFKLEFPENRPENFTIKVKALAMIGIFPSWYTSKEFICILDGNERDYHCKK